MDEKETRHVFIKNKTEYFTKTEDTSVLVFE